MEGVKNTKNGGNGGCGRGTGKNGDRRQKSEQCFTSANLIVETDFNGEGLGYQQQQKKRRRRSTGGTVIDTKYEHSDNLDSQTSYQNLKGYKSLSADDKLDLILSKVSLNENSMNDLQNKFDSVFGKNGRIAQLEQKVEVQTDRLTALEYRSIDLEARSRRNNLLFKGFKESPNENCEILVTNFLHDMLQLDSDMPIQRAHRLGRQRDDNSRFIIVAFLNFQDTESIIRQCYKLKGSAYAISRDFPAEIVTARKVLWPNYRDLRSKHRGDRVYIAYPAKLIHNGREVRNMFPNWDTALHKSRTPQVDRDGRARHREVNTQSDLHISVYDNSTEASSADSVSESDDQMSIIEEDCQSSANNKQACTMPISGVNSTDSIPSSAQEGSIPQASVNMVHIDTSSRSNASEKCKKSNPSIDQEGPIPRLGVNADHTSTSGSSHQCANATDSNPGSANEGSFPQASASATDQNRQLSGSQNQPNT